METTERQANDPSEEEIAAKCAEIRRRWTPSERERRRVVKSEPVGVTEVQFDDELPAEW
jgi:hypothetical protein